MGAKKGDGQINLYTNVTSTRNRGCACVMRVKKQAERQNKYYMK